MAYPAATGTTSAVDASFSSGRLPPPPPSRRQSRFVCSPRASSSPRRTVPSPSAPPRNTAWIRAEDRAARARLISGRGRARHRQSGSRHVTPTPGRWHPHHGIARFPRLRARLVTSAPYRSGAGWLSPRLSLNPATPAPRLCSRGETDGIRASGSGRGATLDRRKQTRESWWASLPVRLPLRGLQPPPSRAKAPHRPLCLASAPRAVPTEQSNRRAGGVTPPARLGLLKPNSSRRFEAGRSPPADDAEDTPEPCRAPSQKTRHDARACPRVQGQREPSGPHLPSAPRRHGPSRPGPTRKDLRGPRATDLQKPC